MKLCSFLSVAALMLAVWMQPTVGQAAETLLLKDTSGAEATFLLSSHPTVTVDAQYLTLSTDESTIQYPRTSSLSFSFGGDVTGIEAVTSGGEVFAINNEGISMSQLSAGEAVQVYNLQGWIVAQGVADETGCLTLLYAAQRGTTLVVKAAQQSFRYIIK